MNLKSWQKRVCGWFGLLIGVLILVVSITYGISSANEIDQRAHHRWSKTTGIIQSVSHQYGVSSPQTYTAVVSYRAYSRSKSLKITIDVGDGIWKPGARLRLWYATAGATYVPADNKTSSGSPLPRGGAVIFGWTFVGIIFGLLGGFSVDALLEEVFKRFQAKNPAPA